MRLLKSWAGVERPAWGMQGELWEVIGLGRAYRFVVILCGRRLNMQLK